MKKSIRFTLNGRPATLDADDEGMLLWALRTRLELTGAKHGCGEGLCGACTVLVDGRAVRSCTTSLKRIEGRSVTTVEGLASGGKLSALQQAFIDHGAFQCGFCTPGVLLSAQELLRANPKPTREQIAAHLDHHLCRCGTQQRVIDAVQAAAARTGGAS